MELQGIISKWHLNNDDVHTIYRATRAIEGDINRMSARRYWVADILNRRGIAFNAFVLENDTPAISNAIDYQVWTDRGVVDRRTA